LLSSFVAKENTIATLGVLFENEAGINLSSQIAQVLTPAAALAFMVFQMTFIPCIASLGAIKSETGSWKWPLMSIIMLLIISISAAFIVYNIAIIIK
jgi:ferrous iron transport protein B